jgi:hypothetical protein
MFLDIIHRPVLTKNAVLFISQKNVSEIGYCLRLQVKHTQLGPIDRDSPYLRKVVLFNKTKTVDTSRNVTVILMNNRLKLLDLN